MSQEDFISVVIPAFNEQDNLPKLIPALVTILKRYGKYEIIIVNDGSSDNTANVAKQLHDENEAIHYISFVRNFGHQYALKAGLDLASGDCVISMDADMQHPVELIPQMISSWKQGNEVVYTVRQETKNETVFKRTTSRLFYKVFNFLTDLKLPQGAADFRLLDRAVVDYVKSLPEKKLFLRGIISWIGFKQHGIPYVPPPRYKGKSSYTFRKMLSLATTGAVSFSLKPLRLAIYLGLILGFLGCLFVGYVLYVKFFNGTAISGWASLMSVLLILGGTQLIVMGIIGEYIGMIFMETKNRPQYIISKTSLKKEKNEKNC